MSQYKNENLIFPFGTYDYASITGRHFNLENHNQVARLVYMGEDDTNNTVLYYRYEEKQLIEKRGKSCLGHTA